MGHMWETRDRLVILYNSRLLAFKGRLVYMYRYILHEEMYVCTLREGVCVCVYMLHEKVHVHVA